MAIEFDIKTAKGVSNLDRLTKAWGKNRDRVNSATAAYDKQTVRLGKALLENQRYEKSLRSLEGEYVRNRKQITGLSTTVKVLSGRIGVLEAEISTLTAKMTSLNAHTSKTVKSQAKLRSAFRGTAGALGGLWLAYGDILPMMAAFAASTLAKDILTQGASFRYTTKFITMLGKEAGTATVPVEELREKLVGFEGLRKGPQELALGMKEFAKAGVDTVTALDNIEEMARFATIAELDLASATGLVIGQANAFGVSYSDAANMITAAAMSSATSIQEMTQAMAQTTELASVSKVEFHEVATALAVLANNGIRGSKAGTAIRTSIIRMQTPTSKLKGMLEDLNIQWSAFTSDGKVKSVRDMFIELDRITRGLTDEKRIALFRELFGLRAMKGGANIINNIVSKFAELDDKVRESVEGVTLLQRAHKEMADETVSNWEELGVKYEKIVTKIKSSGAADILLALSNAALDVMGAVAAATNSEKGYLPLVHETPTWGVSQSTYSQQVAAEDFAKKYGHVMQPTPSPGIGGISLEEFSKRRIAYTKHIAPTSFKRKFVTDDELANPQDPRDALAKLQALRDETTDAINKLILSETDYDLLSLDKLYKEKLKLAGKDKKLADDLDTWHALKQGAIIEKSLKSEEERIKKELESKEQGLKAEQELIERRQALEKDASDKLRRLHLSDKEAALLDLQVRFEKETEHIDKTSEAYKQLSKVYRYEADQIKGINFDLIKELKNAWDDFGETVKTAVSSGLSSSFKALLDSSGYYADELASIQGKIRDFQYSSLQTGTEQMAFLQQEYDATLAAAMDGNTTALHEYLSNLETYLAKAKEEMDPVAYEELHAQTMRDLDALNQEYADNTAAKWAALKDIWNDLWDSMLDKLIDTLVDMAVAWAASQVSSMFSGWKFHDGLWNLEDDELPAILQRGEMVIPAPHAEQIRENLTGVGDGTGDVFDAVVQGTSLIDLRGWEDEFSTHLSQAYKDDFVGAVLGTIASGNPLTGILGFLGPQVGIQNISQALAETGLDVMGMYGSWADAGFMIGSVLSTMMMGGPLASVTGFNSIGGFVGAIAADMIGDMLDAREFEAVRDELEGTYGLSSAQQAQAVKNLEAFQDEWGVLSPTMSLDTTLSLMSKFTGRNIGLSDLLAVKQDERKKELEEKVEESLQELFDEIDDFFDEMDDFFDGLDESSETSFSEGLDDSLHDFFDGIDESSETSFSGGIDDSLHDFFDDDIDDFFDDIDDFFDDIDDFSESSSSEEGGFDTGGFDTGGFDTGGGTPDHESGGSFGMARGGVVDKLYVPDGDDGFVAMSYGEGVIDKDTMRILTLAIRNGAFSQTTNNSGGGLPSSQLSKLISYVAELKNEVSAANFAIAKNTQDTVKLLRKMDAIGLGVRSN